MLKSVTYQNISTKNTTKGSNYLLTAIIFNVKIIERNRRTFTNRLPTHLQDAWFSNSGFVF